MFSAAMDHWAYTNGVILDFSRGGKPTDNAAIESFNGRFREECLNIHWFASVEDAQQKMMFGGTTMRTILSEPSRASALENMQWEVPDCSRTRRECSSSCPPSSSEH
jgi:putative transposase